MPAASMRSPTHGRIGWRPAALALALLATWDHAAAQEPITAVWKERRLQFSYRGFDAVYPCGLLEHRVALVLAAVGGRPDVEVNIVDCSLPIASASAASADGASWPRSAREPAAGFPVGVTAGADAGWSRTAAGSGSYRRAEPQQVVDVRVRMSVPTEMTPEVIAEIATDRKRRELITRVTGDPRPLFDDPIPFTAFPQVVTLSRETIDLEPADCELLDQMASSIFKELNVRVLRRGYSCGRNWRSRIPPTLEVEAMLPAGFTRAPPETPGEAEYPGDPAGPGGSSEPGSPAAEGKG